MGEDRVDHGTISLIHSAVSAHRIQSLYRLFLVICCGPGEGRKRSQMSMAATSEYTLGGKDVDLTNMVGVIKTPGGGTEQCLLKKMPDGKLGNTM